MNTRERFVGTLMGEPVDRVPFIKVFGGTNAAHKHWEDEYRFRCADDTYADVLDRGYVLRDRSGKGLRMLGAMQDLTDRKRGERIQVTNLRTPDEI